MRGDASAYAALGLEPGADLATIERAYKRLIKQHHPDRQGGDVSRATEINQAYRDLRKRLPLSDPLILADEEPQGMGNSWAVVAMAFLVALIALLLATGPVTALIRSHAAKTQRPPVGRVAASSMIKDVMDQPLDNRAIDGAVRDAVRLAGRHDDDAALTASQDCQRALRLQPGIARLDRCAAFDDAVVQLQNRDPTWDGGPFSQIAVTRRQWSAASSLSNDYLAVDGRLDRIRLQVELTLAATSLPRRENNPGN